MHFCAKYKPKFYIRWWYATTQMPRKMQNKTIVLLIFYLKVRRVREEGRISTQEVLKWS